MSYQKITWTVQQLNYRQYIYYSYQNIFFQKLLRWAGRTDIMPGKRLAIFHPFRVQILMRLNLIFFSQGQVIWVSSDYGDRYYSYTPPWNGWPYTKIGNVYFSKNWQEYIEKCFKCGKHIFTNIVNFVPKPWRKLWLNMPCPKRQTKQNDSDDNTDNKNNDDNHHGDNDGNDEHDDT